MADVLVVGGGLAGVRSCEQLRAVGFEGRITLMGSEDVAPYDRPPLSKQPGADVDLRSAMGLDVFALADEVRLGTPARSLVALRDGRWAVESDEGLIPGDAVIVATGAEPVMPRQWREAGVRTMRTRADSHHFWDPVDPASRLLIIGGGWIGCELAATAAARAGSVHLVEAGPHVLAELPHPAARWVEDLLTGMGVSLHLGGVVEDVRQDGVDVVAALGRGDDAIVLRGDIAVAGLGVRPSTGWLAGSGVRLTPGGAVATDPWGRASQPGVFAVGDAASRYSEVLGRRLSSGHWTEAMKAPVVVAAAVREWLAADLSWWGRTPAAKGWEGIAYVFSDLGDARLLVLGDAAGRHPPDGQEVTHVWREDRGWTCFTLSGGRLLGLASTRPRDIVVARRAMSSDPRGAPLVNPEALADASAAPAAMFLRP